MELGDIETNGESFGCVKIGFYLPYAVHGGSTTKQQFVRSRKGAISRVSPKVVEEFRMAHLDAGEANLISSLRRERSGIVEDCRHQPILVSRWPADDNPVQHPVSFEDRILKNLSKVYTLRSTHFGTSLDECRRLLNLRMLHHVPNRLIYNILDIFDVLWRAIAKKFNQA